MVFTDNDKEDLKNDTHCHICEGELTQNSTKIDHLANIKYWVKIIGLQGRALTYKEGKNKMIYCKDIPVELFKDTITKLKEYLIVHNNIVVRDSCHWTGKLRGAANQHYNIVFRKHTTHPFSFIASQGMIPTIFSRTCLSWKRLQQ